MRMAPLPLGAQGRKPALRKSIERTMQFRQQPRKRDVTIRRGAARSFEIRCRLPDPAMVRRRKAYVDADPDDGCRGSQRIALKLDQNAGQFAPVPEDIVRPFQLDPAGAERLNSARDRHAGRQAQARERAGAPRETPQQRECEPAAERRMPGPPQAAASPALPFGGDYRRCLRALRGALEQARAGRGHTGAEFEPEARSKRPEVMLDARSIEQGQRPRETITAAGYLIDIKAERLELANRMPDTAARHLKRVGKRFARMKLGVGEELEYARGQGSHRRGIE